MIIKYRRSLQKGTAVIIYINTCSDKPLRLIESQSDVHVLDCGS